MHLSKQNIVTPPGKGGVGESAPTKPQIGGWVGAVHRIWVTFGVPVRGTSQICLRGIRHED